MFQRQQHPLVDRAIKLFLNTQTVFAECQANGILVDAGYLDGVVLDTQNRLDTLERELWDSKEGKIWKDIYGENAALTNRQQLAEVLFSKTNPKSMGLECDSYTSTGRPQVSKESLEKFSDISGFVGKYVRWMSLAKMMATNLMGIKKALDDRGFLHPEFSLFKAVSYRTSSEGRGKGINFQNLPKRNKELADIVRHCFVPRAPDRHIVELDYSGAEVRATASITGDPTLIGSVTEGVDFHKMVASVVYMLPEDEVTKELRESVKGPFTFAAFYGSYWVSIAKNLWEQIEYGNLFTKDGTPLREHLKRKGIRELGSVDKPTQGTYYHHVRKTEQWFWGDLFKVYADWKKSNWEDYKETGYIDFPTGFRSAGIFRQNNVNNYAQQGGSAHCLLWAMGSISETIKKFGFDACVCGQIHDSIVMDVHSDVLDEVLKVAIDIMTQQLGKEMYWIRVPMEADADVSPAGKSWFEAKAYSF